MVRVVRTSEGIRIDPSGKLPGRGAYLHETLSCWEVGLKNALTRSLRINLTPDDLEYLSNYMQSLPKEIPSENLPGK
jgi:predicted RNA-binding protein YlxR (DUF448 family)